jgi:hypothetical protein
MSVQNISAATDPTISQDYSNAQAMWTKFHQMGKALENGDLAQAQADYAALMKTAPAFVQDGQGPMGHALAKLGSDLQSGSLSSAQQDFHALAYHLRHRHVAAEGSASSGATAGSTSSAGGTSSASSVLDVQA